MAAQSPEIEFTHDNLVNFLIKLLSKELKVRAFPASFPHLPHTFQPSKNA